MSRRCDITGKGPQSGNRVSHAHNKTRMRQNPNLQRKRLWVPELDKFVRVRVSTSALRSIDKVGLVPFLRKNGLTLSDIS